MNRGDIQQKHITDLLELAKENPTLRIVPMVNTDVVASDDWAWWVARWSKAEIEEIYQSDERCYVRSRDEEELIEDLLDDIDEYTDEDYAYEQAKKQVVGYGWEKVITVRITI